MRCPFCSHLEDKVVDSREAKDGDSIRRRRECLGCGRRFTSYERIDEIPYMVVKKDGKREQFYRDKVLAGLLKAAEKRPVSTVQLEKVADEVERNVLDSLDRELATTEIGKIIMRRLKTLDKVAYVRFASVYLNFEDVSEFMTELKQLVGRRAAALLEAGRKAKLLAFDTADEAYGTLYGLIVRDSHVRMLLGEPPVGLSDDRPRRARLAISQFFRLYGHGAQDTE